MGIVVGIDGSRNRSGGAKSHLKGILGAGDPRKFGVDRVHVWSYQALLDSLPEAPWLTKHAPAPLQGSLYQEAWWQLRSMPRELRRVGCDVLLSLDAGTIGRFSPSVVMSRDMLSFEPREIIRFGSSSARLRLLLLKFIQVASLRSASGALFLTDYAANVIQGFTGRLPRVRIIPHGIGESFRVETHGGQWVEPAQRITCVYVSNADLYKHQWHVVSAVAQLRKAGYPLLLRLVGGRSGRASAMSLLEEAVDEFDSQRNFVEVTGPVPHVEIPRHLASADIFVFASSCENMPNTLVEAMASGLPIACANRGPMPEILQDGGAYFDPESPESIGQAIQTLLTNKSLRIAMGRRALELSQQYSWERCAQETWSFLVDVSANGGNSPSAL
jgi:glycosyltransferase involved in cell wall biosynthesis